MKLKEFNKKVKETCEMFDLEVDEVELNILDIFTEIKNQDNKAIMSISIDRS
tara:strand:- start:569 stop:724 length:156 start_codon:yes stop_codon:yes gene_type:complete